MLVFGFGYALLLVASHRSRWPILARRVAHFDSVADPESRQSARRSVPIESQRGWGWRSDGFALFHWASDHGECTRGHQSLDVHTGFQIWFRDRPVRPIARKPSGHAQRTGLGDIDRNSHAEIRLRDPSSIRTLPRVRIRRPRFHPLAGDCELEGFGDAWPEGGACRGILE